MQSSRYKSPHLSLAKNYWKAHLRPHDFAIDMTCGNGHDTQFLAELLVDGTVFSLDIQESALRNAKILGAERVHFLHQSHSDPILLPLPSAPHLIVYNLGYLPGGDKNIVTKSETTLQSVRQALAMLDAQGAISITCYPGHDEGLREQEALIAWAEALPPSQWQVCLHRWVNRPRSPSLLWISAHG